MSLFRNQFGNNPVVLDTLRKREMRIENTINKFRGGFLLIITLLDMLSLLSMDPPNWKAALNETVVLVVTMALIFLFHKLTSGKKYRPWVKYLTVTIDFSITFFYCYQLLYLMEFPYPIAKSQFLIMMSFFFILFNLLSVLRAEKRIIYYSTFLCLLFNTLDFIIPGNLISEIVYTDFFVLVTGYFCLWVSTQIIQNVISNVNLSIAMNELKQANVEILQQKEEIVTQRDAIEEQKDELEEKNKNITDSINYARRIQNALLPPAELMQQALPDHFILFKPRDIVSGDFYWAKTIETRHLTEDGRGGDSMKKNVIICVADCTGHGVPGAFMSMLGTALLNEIVNKIPVKTRHASSLQANEILNRLRENIMKSLHQTGREGEQKDGMDIALCIIDGGGCRDAQPCVSTTTIQYAGANNPLYIVETRHASSLQPIINEIRPDKMPIGVTVEAGIRPFTNNIVQINKGDCLYLFSDGYADQFGGPVTTGGGKKLKYKQFKEILLSNSEKPMPEQKIALNNAFENWKGSFEQVDDVLVIGIKI